MPFRGSTHIAIIVLRIARKENPKGFGAKLHIYDKKYMFYEW